MLRSVIRGLLLVAFVLLAVVPAPADETPPRIDPATVKARLDSGQQVIFIDTRTGGEWDHSNQIIPGAIRVRGGKEFQEALTRLDKDDFIVTYCT